MENLEFILKIMEREGRRRNAKVFELEKENMGNPFKMLISTILSSRTRDENTIIATRKLFSRINNAEELSKLDIKTIEKLIYGVGFYKTKAKNIKKTSEILINKFNKNVPSNLDDLLKLKGVGRKTANIVLSRCFGKDALGVDTHVHKISNRIGWVKTKKPEETEKKLIKIVPKKFIRKFNLVLVSYGQTICTPKNPKCEICKIRKFCRRVGI
ncbi:MAG: endonuclease III [Candidatus Micrarchaeia archaeon]